LRSVLAHVSPEQNDNKEEPAIDNDHSIKESSGDNVSEATDGRTPSLIRDSQEGGEESEDDGPNLAELLVEISH
jgi:hypothetical protein